MRATLFRVFIAIANISQKTVLHGVHTWATFWELLNLVDEQNWLQRYCNFVFRVLNTKLRLCFIENRKKQLFHLVTNKHHGLIRFIWIFCPSPLIKVSHLCFNKYQIRNCFLSVDKNAKIISITHVFTVVTCCYDRHIVW